MIWASGLKGEKGHLQIQDYTLLLGAVDHSVCRTRFQDKCHWVQHFLRFHEYKASFFHPRHFLTDGGRQWLEIFFPSTFK